MTPAAAAEAIRGLRDEIADLKGEIRDLKKDIRGVRDFQLWVTGAVSAVAFFGGLFSAKIKAALGI